MCASVRDATLPAFNCSLRSRSAFTRPRIGSRTVITAHTAVMAAKVATAASSVAMSTAVRPMNRVVASGVMRVPSSDLEIDHLGHDEGADRSEEHTSELQSLMRNSYAVFCLKNKTTRMKVNRERHTRLR